MGNKFVGGFGSIVEEQVEIDMVIVVEGKIRVVTVVELVVAESLFEMRAVGKLKVVAFAEKVVGQAERLVVDSSDDLIVVERQVEVVGYSTVEVDFEVVIFFILLTLHQVLFGIFLHLCQDLHVSTRNCRE